MKYSGPNRPLTLPARSNDIFDANYHPDLDALIELRFQAYKNAGIGSKIREPETREEANTTAWKILVGLFIGVPVLTYIMYKFAMILGY